MSEKNNKTFTMVALVSIAIFIGFVIYAITNPNEARIINFGEFSVALGTIILALFTYQLASTEIEESKKERRRLRIQEQLENFYSQLRAEMESFLDRYRTVNDLHKGFEDTLFRLGIKGKYEFLALENLKEQFREYYKNLQVNSVFLQRYRTKEGNNMTDTYIAEKIGEIRKTIIEDYDSLIEEYNELTQ